MVKINNLTNSLYSDEWYTDQETVDLVIKLLQPTGLICCPFDTKNSLFVQSAKQIGNCVYGMNDWLLNDYEYDYLMTNPPFSLKTQVIEKVAKSFKPSALIMPLDSLGGVARHSIYRQYGYPAVYMPANRIKYFDSNWDKKQGSNFHSVILLFHTNWEGIIWESKS